MSRETIAAWLTEHILKFWWVRYLVIPAFQSGPAAWVALLIGLGDKSIWGYHSAYAVLAAAIWSGLSSAIVAVIDRTAAIPIERIRRERNELLRLIGYVRTIVGFKSRRFHEASQTSDPIHPTTAFLTITKPDAQIREIARAIHDFFSVEAEPGEAIKISVMDWNAQKQHLAFLTYFPDSERPTARDDAFSDASTIAGYAYFHSNIVVSEDIATDSRYQQIGARDGGSMLAYPVFDAERSRVALVVNVVSDKVKRFRTKDGDALKIPMQVFGDRLLLEYRLRGLLHRVTQNMEAS